MNRNVHRILTFAALVFALPQALAAEEESVGAKMASEAAQLRLLVASNIGKAFLDAVSALPAVPARRVYYNKSTREAMTMAAAAEKGSEALAGYEERELDSSFYYYTRYGTPLAFVRPLDLLAQAGLESIQGKRIVDFGFGSIGQLRLLASLGAEAVGVDVDALLQALYSDTSDTGRIPQVQPKRGSTDGRVQLVFGRFPADPDITTVVGDSLDVFISKNTLKNGYIHPAQDVDPRMLVHLGVDDTVFVRAVYDALKPGGFFLVYNLCPQQSKDKYIPWADGRSPFARQILEQVGFEVLAFDRDDTETARKMGHALGWDKDMNLATDLFGTYTLARK